MVGRMVVIFFLVVIVLTAVSYCDGRVVEVCINNCGQCKQMFGRYFQGQACAEDCLATRGMALPDCNNPKTLRGYLKRFYQ